MCGRGSMALVGRYVCGHGSMALVGRCICVGVVAWHW